MRLPFALAIGVMAVMALPRGFPGGTAGGAPASLGPAFHVASTYPGDGATDVLTDPVLIRFSQPVDPASITTSSVRVLFGGVPIAGDPAVGSGPDGRPDPRSVIWTPAAPLGQGLDLTLAVTRDVRSVRGRGISDPFQASFTTSAVKSLDSILPLDPRARGVKAPHVGPRPRVTWTFPQAGLGTVFTDFVTVRFNRRMDEGSLVGGTVAILQDGSVVAGSVSFSEDLVGREVTFTSDLPLFKDTVYEMVVTRDARTVRHSYLDKDFHAGFGTSPFKNGVKPVLPEDFREIPGVGIPAGRALHTATPLGNGDVLIAGGQSLGGNPIASCAIFRAGSRTVDPAAPMNHARRKHAAIATPGGGVVVVGGFGASGETLSSVEAYDPASDTWTELAPLATGRASHTATALDRGRILVVGGYTNSSGTLAYASTAELYDPLSGGWILPAGAPFAVRGGHTATVLLDGRVLLAGGTLPGVRLDEVYDPQTGIFTATSQPLEERIFHAACLTKNGQVLLAGGGPARAEQFDPTTMSFHEAGSCPPFNLPVAPGPLFPTLSLLGGDGRIALVGGLVPGGAPDGSDIVLDQVQLWDPAGGGGIGAFYPMPFSLEVPRAGHTATRLPDGNFVLVGGFGTTGASNEQRVTVFTPSH